MMNNGGLGGNGNWIWIIFLFFLYGWNRNGFFGNNGVVGEGTIASTAEREMLLQAINGNGAAIGNLATTLNCDINSVKDAINAVQSSICSVGNQVGLTGQQVINAIQQGNMSLAQQFAQCCCDNKLLVQGMGYEGQLRDQVNTNTIVNTIGHVNDSVNHGFSRVSYETSQQTCSIQNGLRDQTQTILNKLDALEDSRKDREIAELTAKLTAANSRAERQAELTPIYQKLNDIGCKQPNTVTVPYQPFVTVPNCVAWNGVYGFPYGQNGSIWS